ncbi:hypothetical protein [Pseudomonas sp. BN417]|nr:hypothetical protein [Pseudomonas sp. BN417]
MNIADLGERQLQVVIQLPGAVHLIPVTLVRDGRAGRAGACVLY